VQDLSGLTLEDALVRVVPRETVAQVSRIGDLNQRLALVRKQQRAERRSSLLLTHFGLSGPAAMDVSRRVTDCGRADEVQLVCDLLPEWTVERLQSELSQQVERQGQRSIGRWLSEALPVPQRLVGSLLQQISVDPQQRIAELSKASRLELLAHLKSLVVPVSGSRGFTKAEVTAGGVSLSDVDSKTMASRRAEGLYLAGEVLDIDGPIGGYNFQAAFSTGWLAADSASQ
jgi:predicted Rossmann fold flavoprotein